MERMRAIGNGAEMMVLFETLGGWSPDVTKMLRRAVDERGNKLRGSEYDATTWSARSWSAYFVQRVSCALMRAVAWVGDLWGCGLSAYRAGATRATASELVSQRA